MKSMRFFRARSIFHRAESRPSLPPPASAVNATGLDRWRSLTLRGNVAFEQGENTRARRHYDDALAMAEVMMTDAASSGDPQALVVAPLLHGMACSNIIELARIGGDRETVGIYTYRRASCLISIIESPDAPLELRSRCLLHLKVAAGSLYDYFEQGGMWDAAAAFSERANAAMFVLGQRQSAQSSSPEQPRAFEHEDDDALQLDALHTDTRHAEQLHTEQLHTEQLHAESLHTGSLHAEPSPVARGFLPGRMGSL